MKIPIAGALTGENREQIPVLNPVTNEQIDTVPCVTKEDIDFAVEAAKEGQTEWGALSQQSRNKIMRKFVELYEQDRHELATLLSRETGKILSESEGEMDSCTNLTNGYCEKAAHMYGNCLPGGSTEGNESHDITFTRFEPLGTIACLLPFNFPIDLFGHKAIPALVAGNAVIVKPSTDNPLTVIRMVEYLHKAGVPKKAAQVVTGRGSMIGDYLVSHPGIQAVSMTGSTKVGISIYQKAAANLTRVFLELGGNDAFVVLEDSDVDLAVKEAIGSRVPNAGQICCASKRFIVHRSLAESFAEKLIAALKEIKMGDPFDPTVHMGSLISKKAAEQVEEQVNYTLGQGATLAYGGKRDGAFYCPTVLTNVTAEMDIAKDLEIFAAVFPIIPFDTAEEAVKIANQSSYGLSGAVFSSDAKKAICVAAKMKAGGVVINGGSCFRTPDLAFGGFKKSGIGREGVSRTLEEMVQEKNYSLKNIL